MAVHNSLTDKAAFQGSRAARLSRHPATGAKGVAYYSPEGPFKGWNLEACRTRAMETRYFEYEGEWLRLCLMPDQQIYVLTEDGQQWCPYGLGREQKLSMWSCGVPDITPDAEEAALADAYSRLVVDFNLERMAA